MVNHIDEFLLFPNTEVDRQSYHFNIWFFTIYFGMFGASSSKQQALFSTQHQI